MIDLLGPESREEKALRRTAGWCAWAIVLVLLLVVASQARAAEVFSGEGRNGKPVKLKLYATPCTNTRVLEALRARVRDEFVGQFRRAVLTWDGREWASCWMEHSGHIFSVDEAGDPFQPIPRSMFRDDSV